MSIQHLSTKYSFRATTQDNHAYTQQIPDKNPVRKILPIELTPSIVEIDSEASSVKEDLRLLVYYINALIETTLKTPLHRAKTDAQGSQAPKGRQAAHSSLAPNTQDDFTPELIKRVEEYGVTPVKSKPFLRSRIALTSPRANFWMRTAMSQVLSMRLS